jgi:hypothetical protein
LTVKEQEFRTALSAPGLEIEAVAVAECRLQGTLAVGLMINHSSHTIALELGIWAPSGWEVTPPSSRILAAPQQGLSFLSRAIPADAVRQPIGLKAHAETSSA